MRKSESPGASNTRAVCTEENRHETGQLRILIDWFGFTFLGDNARIDNVLKWFEVYLKIDRHLFKTGRRNYEGYAESLVYENINIYYQGQETQGIHVDFTGQGCRFLDVHWARLRVQEKNNTIIKANEAMYITDWRRLLTLVHFDENIKITRMDVACDDFHGYLDVNMMFKKALQGEMTMKYRTWQPAGKFDSNGESKGMSLYFGSDDSRQQTVFYEKNKQLKQDYHWVRCEMRFYKERANEMIKAFVNNPDVAMGVMVAGLLKNNLTFREPNPNDSNKRRWEVSPFWTRFLEGVPKLQIASALPDRSIMKSKKWLHSQVSKTLAMQTLAMKGINDNWFTELLKDGLLKLDSGDYDIINEFRNMFEDNTKMLAENFSFTQKKDNDRDTNQCP